jgi:hypothetical protein
LIAALALAAVLAGDVPAELAEARASLAEAERLRAEGQQLAFHLESEAALAKLEQAIVMYQRGALALSDATPLAQCHTSAAATWLALGKKDRALQQFRQAVALRTGYRPTDTTFAPHVLAMFRQAERELAREPRSSLTVTGGPAGAAVTLDARTVGELPVSIPDLMPGGHWLVVRKAGYESFVTQVTVPAGSSQKSEVFLRALQRSEQPAAVASAPVVVVTPPPPLRDGKLPLALALLPFGGGQFAEGRPGAGVAFLSTELALVATTLVTGIVVLNDRAPGGYFNQAQRDRALQGVNIAAFTLLVLELAAGATDGYLRR